jgi:hypothetical protein
VLATEYGLTLNDEQITENALATFPDAMPDGQPSRFFHPDEKLPYPPVIGTLVGTPEASNKDAHVVIDYDEGFARNFDSGNKYAVSVYSLCKWHWDTYTCIRVVDEFVYHPDNSVDVVPYGAVPSAKVLGKVEDKVKNGITNETKEEFVRCSIAMVPTLCDEPRQKEGVEMNEQQIRDAIAAAITDSKVTVADDDVTRIADAVASAVSAVTVEPPAKEPEVDIAEVIADSFAMGVAVDGFTEGSIERVKNSIKGGATIEDALAIENAIIDEFKKQFETTDVTESGTHKYGDGAPAVGAKAIAERILNAKKGA